MVEIQQMAPLMIPPFQGILFLFPTSYYDHSPVPNIKAGHSEIVANIEVGQRAKSSASLNPHSQSSQSATSDVYATEL